MQEKEVSISAPREEQPHDTEVTLVAPEAEAGISAVARLK